MSSILRSFVFLAALVLLCGCGTTPVHRVDASAIVHRNKGARYSEFIGFADNRAFVLAHLVPSILPFTPSQSIWWCPVSELSSADIAALKRRLSRNRYQQLRGAD